MDTSKLLQKSYTVFSSKDFRLFLVELTKRAVAVDYNVEHLWSMVEGKQFRYGILQAAQADLLNVASRYVDPNVNYEAANYTNFPVYYTPGRVYKRHPIACIPLPGCSESMFAPGTINKVKAFITEAMLVIAELHIVEVGWTNYDGHISGENEPAILAQATKHGYVKIEERRGVEPDEIGINYPSKYHKTGYEYDTSTYSRDYHYSQSRTVYNSAPFRAKIGYYIVGENQGAYGSDAVCSWITRCDPAYSGVSSPNRAGTGVEERRYVDGYGALENYRIGNGWAYFAPNKVTQIAEGYQCYYLGGSTKRSYTLNFDKITADYDYAMYPNPNPYSWTTLTCGQIKGRRYVYESKPARKFSLSQEQQDKQFAPPEDPGHIWPAPTGIDTVSGCAFMEFISIRGAFCLKTTDKCPVQNPHPWARTVNAEQQVEDSLGGQLSTPVKPVTTGVRYWSHTRYEGPRHPSSSNDQAQYYWRKDADINMKHVDNASWCNENSIKIDDSYVEKQSRFSYNEFICFVDYCPSFSGNCGMIDKNSCKEIELDPLVMPGDYIERMKGKAVAAVGSTSAGTCFTGVGTAPNISWSMESPTAEIVYDPTCVVMFYLDYTF